MQADQGSVEGLGQLNAPVRVTLPFLVGRGSLSVRAGRAMPGGNLPARDRVVAEPALAVQPSEAAGQSVQKLCCRGPGLRRPAGHPVVAAWVVIYINI